jgi:hypothetical protein
MTTVRCNGALPGWNGAPAYAGLDEMAMFVTCTSALPALKAGIDEKAERMLCLALEVCRDHTQQARQQQQQFPDLVLAAAWAQVSFAIMQRKGVGAAAINVGVVEAGVAALHTMSPHEWYAICVHLCALAVSGTYFQRLLTRLVWCACRVSWGAPGGMSAQSIFFVYWNLAIQNHAGLTELFINTGVIDAALAALQVCVPVSQSRRDGNNDRKS